MTHASTAASRLPRKPCPSPVQGTSARARRPRPPSHPTLPAPRSTAQGKQSRSFAALSPRAGSCARATNAVCTASTTSASEPTTSGGHHGEGRKDKGHGGNEGEQGESEDEGPDSERRQARRHPCDAAHRGEPGGMPAGGVAGGRNGR